MASEKTNQSNNVETTNQNKPSATANEQNIKQSEQQITATPNGANPTLQPESIGLQKNSRQAEDYALSIAQQLDQRRVNVDRLQIDVNGQTVFKLHDGDINARKTSISDQHTELIKKALSDPASLNGSVKITQGNQVLLHVKDGQVLVDSVGLTKQSAKIEVKTPDSPSEGLYERFSKDVTSSGLKATQEIATNALKAGIERQQVVDVLKTQDPSYQKLVGEQGEQKANQTLEKLVDTAEVKAQEEKLPQQQKSQEVKASKSAKV